MAVIWIFINAFIWSSSFALSKLAMDSSSPLFATGSRMLIAGGVLAGIACIQRKSLVLSKSEFLSISLLSFVGFYVANVCEFRGLLHLSAAKACFIYGLSPFVSAFFSYVQLRETVTPKKILGLGLGLVSYITYLSLGGGEPFGCWQIGLPEFLLLSATAAGAYGWTLLRKLEKQSASLSVIVINAYAMLLAGGASLVHSFFVEPWNPTPVVNWGSFLQAILAMVIVSNLICYNLYARLLRKFSSTFLSFCNLVMPFFSSFYGWWLLGEPISASLCIAVACMVVGCRLIYHEEFRQGYIV